MSRREYFKEESRIKNIAVLFSIVLVLTVVAFVFIFNLYNKKLRENARNSLLELGSVNAVVPNQIQIENMVLEPASISQDKGINEVKNQSVNESKTEKLISKHEKEKIENSLDESKENKESTEITSENDENTDGYIAPVDNNTEPNFIAPVSGEIIKDFASDTLLYSKTLDEWTTHYGIDIRADKMTVVAASEAGTVESIKNDPRYRTYYYNYSSNGI